MEVTVHIPDEKAPAIKAQAEAAGKTVEEWLLQIAEEDIRSVDAYQPPGSIAHLQRANPKEWARLFHEWAESHDRTKPPLSDEAVSRDSIYPDRF